MGVFSFNVHVTVKVRNWPFLELASRLAILRIGQGKTPGQYVKWLASSRNGQISDFDVTSKVRNWPFLELASRLAILRIGQGKTPGQCVKWLANSRNGQFRTLLVTFTLNN